LLIALKLQRLIDIRASSANAARRVLAILLIEQLIMVSK